MEVLLPEIDREQIKVEGMLDINGYIVSLYIFNQLNILRSGGCP